MNGTRLDLKSVALGKVNADEFAKRQREQYLAEFKRADKDNNGYLDMAEATRNPLYRNLFKLMDRDGDGMLFEKEVLAYLDAYQDLQAAARGSCASIGIASEGKGLFEMLDTDGDGRLSVREMRSAVKLLAELDRDGKGFITPHRHSALHGGDLPHGAGRRQRRFPRRQRVFRTWHGARQDDRSRRRNDRAARSGSARWIATATATCRAVSSSAPMNSSA